MGSRAAARSTATATLIEFRITLYPPLGDATVALRIGAVE
jgi:hypothetical protein